MPPSPHPYATLEYAETLAHVGSPLYVGSWDAYVLRRTWREDVCDAAGTYPLACLHPQADIGAGIENLRASGLTSIVFVVDGLSGPPLTSLQQHFSEFRAFKTHYLVDASSNYLSSSHHRYEVRRAAQRGVEVRTSALSNVLSEWIALYKGLVSERRIVGAAAFPDASFVALAQCPGMVVTSAYLGNSMIACHLWVTHGETVWSHLAATNSAGYATGAAYAIHDDAIRRFSGCTINLGGTAGNRDHRDDGLARFKEGFSSRKIESVLVGTPLDAAKYTELTRGSPRSTYFPAYRVQG